VCTSENSKIDLLADSNSIIEWRTDLANSNVSDNDWGGIWFESL